MLIDRARIFVKAGNGGNGSSSFRREKYIPRGGPDGGDGGPGGHVRLRAAQNLTSLLPFQYNQKFSAQVGGPGRSQQRHGKTGASLDIDVPVGTMVWDDETGELLADLTEPESDVQVARGGKGGLGNVHFKSSVRQAPRIAELGEPGQERWLRLELRLIADVGLVGLPNAGKSTLLAAATRARPKVADYPFTTLQPHLGVVEVGGVGGQTFVMADIPGLIEGAAEGAGLGHEFLRHVTRTSVLVHVLDASGGLEGRDPLADFVTINEELAAYDPDMASKPMLVALNKVDISEAQENLPRLEAELGSQGYRLFPISGATGQGVPQLMQAVATELRDVVQREQEREAARKADERPVFRLPEVDERAWQVTRTSENTFAVTGIGIERFTRMTDFSNDEGADRFQRVLTSSGISEELERQGVQPGDVVTIASHELFWGEEDELEGFDFEG
jgi:GTPase